MYLLFFILQQSKKYVGKKERKESLISLKGGHRKIFEFFHRPIGPVGHNIWWENSRNGSFGPKKGPNMQ